MALILEVAGVLVCGIALARVLTFRFSQLKRLPLAGAVLVAMLAAGGLFLYHVYEVGSELPEATRVDSAISAFVAQHAADLRANNAFLSWAREKMLRGRGDTYYLEPATVLKEAELGQWSTYELLPERATATPGEAAWIVFYGAQPSLTPEQSQEYAGVVEFSPGYGLAQRADAG